MPRYFDFMLHDLKIIVCLAIALPLMACAPKPSADALQPAPADAGETAAEPVLTTGFVSDWTIIKAESRLTFSATQTGDAFDGEFKNFAADIIFDPANLEAAKVQAEIDLTSVEAGDNERNSALPGKDWFHIKAFPKAVFYADDFIKDGLKNGGYIAKGTLSLRGVQKPIELPFNVIIDGERADMTGGVTIDRGEWGVGQGAWETDEWVSRSVTINVKIAAIKG